MNQLEQAIQQAIDLSGANTEANKAYLEFIKANFIMPIEKNPKSEQVEVLFLQENGLYFLPVFSSDAYFDDWVKAIADEVAVLRLSGVDLLKNIGDDVTVCLNIGSTIYKEFNPSEIARMRSMVLKLFKNP